MPKNTFYITTAIDYPSAKPHLGHVYEKICADVIARWKKLQGFKVHFSTGTDCHGLKIQRASQKANKKPEQFVKEMSNVFKNLCKSLNISNTDFIMTIEPRHKKVIESILKTWNKSKDIYKDYYEGLYCVDCETFYTEKDLENRSCPVHKKHVEIFKEETYFFKLSKYQKEIIKEIEKQDLIWPNKKKKEILNRLKEPIKDLSISRENVSWGIPFPFDKKKTIAVWTEALMNYLTTIDYPKEKYKKFWPAVHIIGSDIVWHHTAIWYSFLSSLKIKLPKVIVHGFINLKGEKLSKSSGIVIDPMNLINKYSTDSIRYFLMRQIPFGDDGDFSEEALTNRHNNELANKLGNLVSRTTTLAEKNGIKKTPNKLIKKLELKKIQDHLEKFEFDKALNLIFAFIDICNEYIQEKKPWETKDKKVLYEVADSIKAITILLWPIIPETSEKISKQFKFKIDYKEIKKPLKITRIKKQEVLFKKI